MACGLPVIDLKTDISTYSYGDKKNVVVLSESDPKSIADNINKLLDDPDLRENYSKNGLAYTETFPDEKQMSRTVQGYVTTKYINNLMLN